MWGIPASRWLQLVFSSRWQHLVQFPAVGSSTGQGPLGRVWPNGSIKTIEWSGILRVTWRGSRAVGGEPRGFGGRAWAAGMVRYGHPKGRFALETPFRQRHECGSAFERPVSYARPTFLPLHRNDRAGESVGPLARRKPRRIPACRFWKIALAGHCQPAVVRPSRSPICQNAVSRRTAEANFSESEFQRGSDW